VENKKAFLIFYLFGLVTFLIGFNWFIWGPILVPIVEPNFQVKPVLAELLITAVPLLLVVFSYFTGTLADRSPKRSTAIAAILLGIFTLLRGIFSFNFLSLLIMNYLFALSASFAFTSWSPVTYRLFEKDKAAKITAYFTAFLVSGQILAFFISFPLASRMGLKNFLILSGVISLVVAVFYLFIIRGWDDALKSSEQHQRLPIFEGFKLVFSNRSLVVLCLIAFLDIGVFKWLAGWYPKLTLTFKGMSPAQAGYINAFILIGCLIGAMTIPDFSHRIKKVKLFFIVLPIVVALMLLVSFVTSTFFGLSFISIIMGIALYPIYPLGLHLPSAFSEIGVEYAGVGSGIILIFSNLGGTIFPLLGSITSGYNASITAFGIVPILLITLLGFIFKDPDTYSK
jgi:predicted MFS family arabinose efflux permease